MLVATRHLTDIKWYVPSPLPSTAPASPPPSHVPPPPVQNDEDNLRLIPNGWRPRRGCYIHRTHESHFLHILIELLDHHLHSHFESLAGSLTSLKRLSRYIGRVWHSGLVWGCWSLGTLWSGVSALLFSLFLPSVDSFNERPSSTSILHLLDIKWFVPPKYAPSPQPPPPVQNDEEDGLDLMLALRRPFWGCCGQRAMKTTCLF